MNYFYKVHKNDFERICLVFKQHSNENKGTCHNF